MSKHPKPRGWDPRGVPQQSLKTLPLHCDLNPTRAVTIAEALQDVKTFSAQDRTPEQALRRMTSHNVVRSADRTRKSSACLG